MASNEKSTFNKEIIMILIIMAIIKNNNRNYIIFTGDTKQISFFATDQTKTKISAEPDCKIPYWPPGKLFVF